MIGGGQLLSAIGRRCPVRFWWHEKAAARLPGRRLVDFPGETPDRQSLGFQRFIPLAFFANSSRSEGDRLGRPAMMPMPILHFT